MADVMAPISSLLAFATVTFPLSPKPERKL
jgi:hypothetical protein